MHFARAPRLASPFSFLVVLLALLPAMARAQSYTFSVFAGNPTPYGHADGTGSEARFNGPLGLATDAAGNIYVADVGNYVVRKITPAGAVSTLAGQAGVQGSADGPAGTATFQSPRGVAVDSSGNVYVADHDAHTIRRIDPAGNVTTIAGAAAIAGSADGPAADARFRNPSAVAVDAAGNLYVSDRGNRTVRKISGGVVTTLAGSPELSGNVDATGSAARFNSISGLTIDAAGNLYLTDIGSDVIRKITPAGVVTTLAGTAGQNGSTDGAGSAARFDGPFAVGADAAGNLYVADTLNECIRRITPGGAVTLFAGAADLAGSNDGTGTSARFFRPQGIAVDGAGNLYVADAANHSIRRVTSNAVVTTLAGPGGNFGTVDGTGAAAQFNRPRGLAIDRSGNLFVTESGSGVIRKITSAGVVSIYAGTPNAFAYQDGTGDAAKLGLPYGIGVDANGAIAFTDQVYNAVRRVTTEQRVFTLSGVPALTGGSGDGAPNVTHFNFPEGVAIARDGTVFVADTFNHTIRRISGTTGESSTFAGLTGAPGAIDGVGTAARFAFPDGLAFDADGNLIVADAGNDMIRRIAPDGRVTTVAGASGVTGTTDANGTAARFNSPEGVAVDATGNIFVADSNNHSVRRIAPNGDVTTIAGSQDAPRTAPGTGTQAKFFVPSGVALGADGALYVVSSFGNTIMKGVLDRAPTIIRQPQSLTLPIGASISLAVSATGGGLSYQWKRNGAAIPGATDSTITLSNVIAASAGGYAVEITNSAGSLTSNVAAITVSSTADVGRITNLAIRSQAGTGAQTLIVGMALGGAGTSGTKPVLFRAVGPTLGAFGVPGTLTDPKLELYSGVTKVAENDDWSGNAQVSAIGAQVGAFALSPAASKDAALFRSDLAPAAAGYTMQITGSGSGAQTGIVLAEIYDATASGSYTATTPRLTNVSARTQVGTGGDILIAGFTIAGSTAKTVLIRAVGPTLASFGVAGTLSDPKLELYSVGATTTKIDENDDWGGATSVAGTFLAVGAFPLQAGSRDAVLLVTLPPGSYTAQVAASPNTPAGTSQTGVALVEVYEGP